MKFARKHTPSIHMVRQRSELHLPETMCLLRFFQRERRLLGDISSTKVLLPLSKCAAGLSLIYHRHYSFSCPLRTRFQKALWFVLLPVPKTRHRGVMTARKKLTEHLIPADYSKWSSWKIHGFSRCGFQSTGTNNLCRRKKARQRPSMSTAVRKSIPSSTMARRVL